MDQLPWDVWEIIISQLEDLGDIYRLLATCKEFYSQGKEYGHLVSGQIWVAKKKAWKQEANTKCDWYESNVAIYNNLKHQEPCVYCKSYLIALTGKNGPFTRATLSIWLSLYRRFGNVILYSSDDTIIEDYCLKGYTSPSRALFYTEYYFKAVSSGLEGCEPQGLPPYLASYILAFP